MKNISQILTLSEKFIKNNAPTILTAVGVTGTVVTAVLASKASYRFANAVDDEMLTRVENDVTTDELTKREKFDLAWKLYVPAVASGTITIACIVMAHQVNAKRLAAVAAAYAIVERDAGEYAEKVKEKLGVKKEGDVRDEIELKRLAEDPMIEGNVIHTGNGTVLFRDSVSGRYFYSSMEFVRRGENDINKQIHSHDEATLTQLYTNWGLPPTGISDYLGWDHEKYLNLKFTTGTTADDQIPCHVVRYDLVPMSHFRHLDLAGGNN